MGWLIFLTCIGLLLLVVLIVGMFALYSARIQEHAELIALLSQIRCIMTANQRAESEEAPKPGPKRFRHP